MKTKSIPIIITLLAAFIVCGISAFQRVEFATYTLRLVIVVVVFGIIGILVRFTVEKAFPIMEEEEETSEESSEVDEDFIADDELHREDDDELVANDFEETDEV